LLLRGAGVGFSVAIDLIVVKQVVIVLPAAIFVKRSDVMNDCLRPRINRLIMRSSLLPRVVARLLFDKSGQIFEYERVLEDSGRILWPSIHVFLLILHGLRLQVLDFGLIVHIIMLGDHVSQLASIFSRRLLR